MEIKGSLTINASNEKEAKKVAMSLLFETGGELAAKEARFCVTTDNGSITGHKENASAEDIAETVKDLITRAADLMKDAEPRRIYKYEDMVIIDIFEENGVKMVRYNAVGYNAGDDEERQYRFSEYKQYEMPLEKVLLEGGIYVARWKYAADYDQYIFDATFEEMAESYETYDNGHLPKVIPESMINMFTECGKYIVEPKKRTQPKKNELMLARKDSWFYFPTDAETIEEALEDFADTCEKTGINQDNANFTKFILYDRDGGELEAAGTI